MKGADDGLPEDEEWNIPFQDLEFGKRVGNGNFGCVYKGEYLGAPVAIKELHMPEEDPEFTRKYIQREVSVLKNLRHPNIVNFVGICHHKAEGRKEHTYIITEWVAKGNLSKWIKRNAFISWKKRVQIAVEMASAMTFLHRKNLIHRDLKPQNVLITETEGIKICDFGFARKKPSQNKMAMTLAGTEEYMAPEVILGMDYDEKCDVYCFGVVLYVLISRKKPPQRSPIDCFEFRPESVNAITPPDCPPAFRKIADDCCEYVHTKRPSFSDILARLKQLLKDLPEETDPEQEAQKKKAEEERTAVKLLNLKRIQEFMQETKAQAATPNPSPSSSPARTSSSPSLSSSAPAALPSSNERSKSQESVTDEAPAGPALAAEERVREEARLRRILGRRF
jgi:serine/threonine protein kinase